MLENINQKSIMVNNNQYHFDLAREKSKIAGVTSFYEHELYTFNVLVCFHGAYINSAGNDGTGIIPAVPFNVIAARVFIFVNECFYFLPLEVVDFNHRAGIFLNVVFYGCFCIEGIWVVLS